MLSDNILALIEKTPERIMQQVAERVKLRRLEQNLTQKALAMKAGVSLASYRRFETKGEIAFRSLVLIAFVLNMADDFDALFATRSYQSIDQLLQIDQLKQRKRGGRKDE